MLRSGTEFAVCAKMFRFVPTSTSTLSNWCQRRVLFMRQEVRLLINSSIMYDSGPHFFTYIQQLFRVTIITDYNIFHKYVPRSFEKLSSVDHFKKNPTKRHFCDFEASPSEVQPMLLSIFKFLLLTELCFSGADPRGKAQWLLHFLFQIAFFEPFPFEYNTGKCPLSKYKNSNILNTNYLLPASLE